MKFHGKERFALLDDCATMLNSLVSLLPQNNDYRTCFSFFSSPAFHINNLKYRILHLSYDVLVLNGFISPIKTKSLMFAV